MRESPRSGQCGRYLGFGVLALTFAAVVFPRSAWAQVELGPRLGVYMPLGAVIEQPTPGPRGLQMHQIAAVFVGARVTAWVTRRLGLEGNAAISPSYVAVTDSTGTSDKVATVVLANARAVLSLNRRKTLYLGSGVGVVDRNGAVWDGTRGTTTPALVLSAGARTPIRSHMSIRLEVEDYISRAQFDQAQPTQPRARAHHDFLWSVGVMIPIRGL